MWTQKHKNNLFVDYILSYQVCKSRAVVVFYCNYVAGFEKPAVLEEWLFITRGRKKGHLELFPLYMREQSAKIREREKERDGVSVCTANLVLRYFASNIRALVSLYTEYIKCNCVLSVLFFVVHQ